MSVHISPHNHFAQLHKIEDGDMRSKIANGGHGCSGVVTDVSDSLH